MQKIWTDFNEMSVDGRCWLLNLDGERFEDALAPSGLKVGDRVILFQEADDFEVEAVLGFDRPGAPALDVDAWFAQPDWPTLKYV